MIQLETLGIIELECRHHELRGEIFNLFGEQNYIEVNDMSERVPWISYFNRKKLWSYLVN